MPDPLKLGAELRLRKMPPAMLDLGLLAGGGGFTFEPGGPAQSPLLPFQLTDAGAGEPEQRYFH